VRHIRSYQYQVFFKEVLYTVADVSYALAAENIRELIFGMIVPGIVKLLIVVLTIVEYLFTCPEFEFALAHTRP